ncbi:hypothetical protein [Streptomyces microflavus]|uniref:hypothetical protein n=1 Tax=Streptomyces microflavus TaxID=1919 RepID=UPI002E340319|nr:hypothetical protein [Streptomyces microflavus]
MGIPWGDIATITLAGAGVAISIVACNAAARSAAEAKRAADSAEDVASVERDRWHADLTPQFDLELNETGNGQALLLIRLAGPDSLRHLDHIAVEVRNDDRDHVALNPGVEVTQADVDNLVWGPYRFSPGVNGTDEHGRSPEPFPLDVGAGTQRAMQRTRPGAWMRGKTQGVWQGEYVGQPIRLVLTCRRGDREWIIARQVENPLFEASA